MKTLFQRKPKNRRLERGNVLDVKLRTKEARAARMRLASTAIGLTLGTVVGFYLVWLGGQWALDALVLHNDAFAVRELDIQTDGVIPVEQLRKWAGVKTGDNLLALDLARIKRDLELAPTVESAAIERVLPHTLKVRVTEREPLAQVKLPQLQPGGGVRLVSYFFDETGYVIEPLASRGAVPFAGADSLPVLSGFSGTDLLPGRAVNGSNVSAALQLLAKFESSPMAGLVDVLCVDVSGPEMLQVTTGQGSQVTFATDRLDEQLRHWRLVFDLGQRTGRAISTLDLSVTNNSPVLWLEARLFPAPIPKSVKPTPYRKRHV